MVFAALFLVITGELFAEPVDLDADNRIYFGIEVRGAVQRLDSNDVLLELLPMPFQATAPKELQKTPEVRRRAQSLGLKNAGEIRPFYHERNVSVFPPRRRRFGFTFRSVLHITAM